MSTFTKLGHCVYVLFSEADGKLYIAEGPTLANVNHSIFGPLYSSPSTQQLPQHL